MHLVDGRTMQVLTTIGAFREARRRLRGTLGFVPTMGYLHEGHMELVRRARAENDHVAASIFVNPTQFSAGEDFAAYPRDLERDLSMLRKEGVALVFHPSPEEMYPRGSAAVVDVGPIAQRLEGAERPGHFRGVATVVAKLFNVVQPDRAYFGQKDGQQVLVIKRLVADLDLPVQIVVAPTVREADGLAMSSRNVYLDPQERKAAVVLSRALGRCEALYRAGERDASKLRDAMSAVLADEPLAEVAYVSVASVDTLEEMERVERPAMASLAVRIGKTRLIDNVLLG